MFAFDMLTNKIKCSELLQEASLNVNVHNTSNTIALLYMPNLTELSMGLMRLWKDV
jgi:hypothetical protein